MLTDISNATVKAYYDLYTSPDDVDLWSAGVSERATDDSVVGPTFGCIIAKTFGDLKKGDRFWYENPGLPNSFTLGEPVFCFRFFYFFLQNLTPTVFVLFFTNLNPSTLLYQSFVENS